MNKTRTALTIFLVVLLCIVTLSPNEHVDMSALAAPKRAAAPAPPTVSHAELTLPDATVVLVVAVQRDDSDDSSSERLASAIIETPDLIDPEITLSDYAYVYYYEVTADGHVISAKTFDVTDAIWVALFDDDAEASPGEPSDAPLGVYELGPYVLEVTEVSRDVSYGGNDLLVIHLNFTNLSDETQSVFWAFDYKAFQRGVEIDTGYLSGEDNLSRDVRPGGTLNDVKISFEIVDNAPVDVEISEFLNFFSNEMIELTFDVPD